jgi:hypothetical protein
LDIDCVLSRAARMRYSLAIGLSLIVACAAPVPESEDISVNDAETVELSSQSQLEGLKNQPLFLYGNYKEQLDGALFLIEEDGSRELGDVLVLNQSERSFTIPTDAEIPLLVMGEVQPLDLAAVDTADQTALAAYDGQLAVYASDITLAPNPAELVANVEAFYDQAIAVDGEVELVGTTNTFILRNPGLFAGKGVIVIQTGDAAEEAVLEGTTVSVTGILRPYVIADLQEDYNLTWQVDLQEKLEAEYESTPVVIADAIFNIE